LLLHYLFENTPAHNVSGWLADWNQAARGFAQKHGFRESGRSRREGIRQGAYYDGILVNILRPEWEAGQEG
jgi:RimJ/RimL family protein N-acetyltransferase